MLLLVVPLSTFAGLDFAPIVEFVQGLSVWAMSFFPESWRGVVVELIGARHIREAYAEDPYHVILEVFLTLLVLLLMVWIALHKSDSKTKSPADELSVSEQQELINEWKPEPLCPELTEEDVLGADMPQVSSPCGRVMTVNGSEVVNFVTTDFLGMSSLDSLRKAGQAALEKYGVGSCGPRGFYGTIDVHLELEKALATFFGTEAAILYSSGFATIASAIPAFSKRGDLLICDESISFPTLTGVDLSRSKVRWFKHNDMDDLENVLKKVQQEDRKGKSKKLNRRFIVVEGLYPTTGQICNLARIVELKNKYRYRLVLEESFSVGVLGKTGRGVCEHFGVPQTEVEFMCASLGNTLSAFGGICVGSQKICTHQTLEGSGYCFSASSPPLICATAIAALKHMEKHPELLTKLHSNSASLHKQLSSSLTKKLAWFGSKESPVVHVRLPDSYDDHTRLQQNKLLQELVDYAHGEGIGLARARYADEFELNLPRPSIRLTAAAFHTADDLSKLVKVLNTGADKLLS